MSSLWKVFAFFLVVSIPVHQANSNEIPKPLLDEIVNTTLIDIISFGRELTFIDSDLLKDQPLENAIRNELNQIAIQRIIVKNLAEIPYLPSMNDHHEALAEYFRVSGSSPNNSQNKSQNKSQKKSLMLQILDYHMHSKVDIEAIKAGADSPEVINPSLYTEANYRAIEEFFYEVRNALLQVIDDPAYWKTLGIHPKILPKSSPFKGFFNVSKANPIYFDRVNGKANREEFRKFFHGVVFDAAESFRVGNFGSYFVFHNSGAVADGGFNPMFSVLDQIKSKLNGAGCDYRFQPF